MPSLNVPNLAFLRNIPVFGAKLYEALHGIQQGVNAVIQQTNANPNGQPDAPPNIDSLKVTAQDGHFHMSIIDQSMGLRRGVQYRIEHADNPAFIGAHQIVIGDSRSHDEYLGNVTRYFRASSSYPSSEQSQYAYHGTQTAPTPVIGGGPTAGPMFLPSQGSGTGAPGQSAGPGPVPERTDSSGFDWRLQRPIAANQANAVSPASQNGIGSPVDSGSGGGGGAGVSLSEAGIARCEYISVGGTGNAITGFTTIPYSDLANGFQVRFVPIHDNSGAATLNVNGIGAKAVTKNGTSALVGGELLTGKCYLLEYDGTGWQIIGVIAPISATVLASDSHGVPSVAPLANTKVWIGSAGSLPVAQAVGGDLTLAADGTGTLKTVNASPGTYGDGTNVAQVTVNGKGLVTAASSVPISFPGTSGFSGTVALAALTALGAQGSLTVAGGLITAYTPPT